MLPGAIGYRDGDKLGKATTTLMPWVRDGDQYIAKTLKPAGHSFEVMDRYPSASLTETPASMWAGLTSGCIICKLEM